MADSQRFLTEVSNERTASDDPGAPDDPGVPDRTDPAQTPIQHSEVELGCPDCLSILDGIFGAVWSCHASLHHPVHLSRERGNPTSRPGHSLAASPRGLLDRRPYFPRKCAP